MERNAPDPDVTQPGGIHTIPARAEPREHILQFFAYEHLPARPQAISAPFAILAESIVANTPRNPERTVALRKLLESKDAAVRAALARSE